MALIGYLLGSIPAGYLMGRLRGIDIRQSGSGNIGATNALRVLGKGPGILVLVIDGLKGFAASQWAAPGICRLTLGPEAASAKTVEHFAIVAGFSAILGHIYTCWLRFRGGKGIATTAGVFGALAPVAMFLTLGIWIVVCALTRYVSVASITAAVTLPIMVWLRQGSATLTAITAVIGLLAIYKHKSNLQRLLRGTEHRLGSQKDLSSAKSTS